jgi:hypothetical protein
MKHRQQLLAKHVAHLKKIRQVATITLTSLVLIVYLTW